MYGTLTLVPWSALDKDKVIARLTGTLVVHSNLPPLPMAARIYHIFEPGELVLHTVTSTAVPQVRSDGLALTANTDLSSPDKSCRVFIKFTVLHGLLDLEHDTVLVTVLLPEEGLQVLPHVVAVGGVDLVMKLRIFPR